MSDQLRSWQFERKEFTQYERERNERGIANTGQLWPQDGTESCLPLAQSGLSKTGLLLGVKRTRRLHCEIPLMTQSGHRRSLNVSHSNRCDCLLNLGGRMKRREFIILVGSAVVSRPLAARSQKPAIPFEGRNLAIAYRWADGHNDRPCRWNNLGGN